MSNGLCSFLEGEIVYYLLAPDLKLLRNLVFIFICGNRLEPLILLLFPLPSVKEQNRKKNLFDQAFIYSVVLMVYTFILLIQICINLCTYLYVYTNIRVYVHMYRHRHIYIHINRYILYTHTHTHIHLHYHPDIHSSHSLREIT